MNVSSDKCSRVLENLSLRQIQVLMETLHRTTLHRKQFVEARYKEQAPNFIETLQFLQDFDWVHKDGDELTMSDDCRTLAAYFSDQLRLAKKIVEAMMSASNPYESVLAEYLAQFKVMGSDVLHRPSPQKRLQESAIRNFLMDMRLVSYQKEDDSFVLNHDHVDLYLWAKNLRGPHSKEALQAQSSKRVQLGASAESAVVQYEKMRVGVEWAPHVEHTSAKHPFACYDVKSVTLNNATTIPRYIEVKAVSGDSYEFFWSAAELEAACLLGNKYFLYLLPVEARGFDVSKLLILANPYISVYKNPDRWLTEENVILCRRKPEKKEV